MLTLQDIRDKSVINAAQGIIIGTVDDLMFDRATAQVKQLLIYGRPRMFGLMGRDADVRIPWEDVLSFGRDVIMVKTEVKEEGAGERGRGLFK